MVRRPGVPAGGPETDPGSLQGAWRQTRVPCRGPGDRLGTLASVAPGGLEAGLAGAVGVGGVDHAVGLVPVATHRPVAAAVVQRRV